MVGTHHQVRDIRRTRFLSYTVELILEEFVLLIQLDEALDGNVVIGDAFPTGLARVIVHMRGAKVFRRSFYRQRTVPYLWLGLRLVGLPVNDVNDKHVG